MDASRLLSLAVLLLALVSRSVAVTTEAELPSTVTSAEEIETTTMSPPPPPRNCSTAKRVEGVCVLRQDCDHSVGPIDLSLYKPKWYTSPCLDDEVCCPFTALVVQAQPTGETEDNSVNDSSFD
ncbi:uncharacterized protein LOC114353013 isoform X2 [Ostrinia furnacalis]|uniref:uncharacterized protein LOC114353013 isoform X2 n=1 Tax=Ostrinia furnacalis TaxID=93504 RepID=UPI00103EA063|nr:uncharacterized protein LOC114353013 isoform X2 [Ostrinia furnacalis]